MACIDCGLAENADGTGRVDIDLDGGLECVGGAGGPVDTAGTGLKIKIGNQADNGVALGSAGLYVPLGARVEYYEDVQTGGVLTGVAIGSVASISISNTTALTKRFMWQASTDIEFEDLVPNPTGVLCQARIGAGAWFAVSGGQFTANSWHSPLIGRVQTVVLAGGASTTISSRIYVDNGTIDSYAANIVAWGGLAP